MPRPDLVRVDEHLAELRARIGAHRLLDEVEKDLARVWGLETFKVHPEKDEPFRFVDFKGVPTYPKESLLRGYEAAILRAQAFPGLLVLMHDLDAWQRDLVFRADIQENVAALNNCRVYLHAAAHIDAAWEKVLTLLDRVVIEGCRRRRTAMKTPTQCALWTTPQLSNDPDFFERMETFDAEEHWSRDLRRCRECGQLYIHDFYEEINWSGGEDYQYACYVPVETAEEIEAMRDVTWLQIRDFYPHLMKHLTRGTMGWVTEP